MASKNISQISLHGFKELEAALLKLPRELAAKVEPVALRHGMIPLRRAVAARAKAIKDTGQLGKSIGLTVRRVRRKLQYQNRYTARVGPRGGFAIVLGERKKGKKKGQKIRRDPRYYAHLIEYGTSRMPAKPFLRPSLDECQDQIMAGLHKGYEIGLAKVIKNLRKK